MKKVLAILTSTVMYGKERSNIEVYNLLKATEDCKFSVIINRKASEKLKDAVSKFKPHAIVSPNRHSSLFRLLTFMVTYVAGNIQTLCYLIRFRPNVLMMCNEITFYDLFPALFFYRGKIIYRIGDEPAFKSLSFRKYNEYVWKHYVLKRVTCCVCISQYIMNTMKAAGRNSENDRIIYNYPPTRLSTDSKEAGLYSNANNHFVFGYIGQIFEQKGIHHLVNCALKLLDIYPDTKFYIAGSLNYKPDYSKMIQSMIPEKKKGCIVFLGEIENIELFFNHIDVLCVPSIKQEPLGNVLVEAKKYSRPCVIYPTGGMPELIRHKVDGFVCKSATEESLMEGLEYYVANKKLATFQGRASYDSIKKMGIDRDSFENNWNNIFFDVL